MLDRPTKFAEAVISGTIDRAIGKTEILACERHLRDLERQGTPEFPYVWSPERAQIIIDFAESLTLAEGEEPLPLYCYPFQDFIFGNWHAWVIKDTEYRRFRTSYIQVARQNGKSLGNAVPSLYYGNFDGYQYPQIYATATKELQAKIVLKECIKFINADEELSGTKTSEGTLISLVTKTFLPTFSPSHNCAFVKVNRKSMIDVPLTTQGPRRCFS